MIAWPKVFDTTWNLCQAANLAPPVDWFPVTNEIVMLNGASQITLTPNAGSRFFRLEN